MWRDFLRLVEKACSWAGRLEFDQWVLVFAGCFLLGVLMLRGFGSRLYH